MYIAKCRLVRPFVTGYGSLITLCIYRTLIRAAADPFLQSDATQIVVVMVGLPARGKSLIAGKGACPGRPGCCDQPH